MWMDGRLMVNWLAVFFLLWSLINNVFGFVFDNNFEKWRVKFVVEQLVSLFYFLYSQWYIYIWLKFIRYSHVATLVMIIMPLQWMFLMYNIIRGWLTLGLDRSGCGVSQPMPSTAEVMQPMPSTAEVMQRMPSTAEAILSIPSSAEVIQPVPATAEVIQPLPSTAEVMQPMRSTADQQLNSVTNFNIKASLFMTVKRKLICIHMCFNALDESRIRDKLACQGYINMRS